ncbi:MAG: DNA replication/repair protein RecF [Chloroflexi bacterium]|nr:DNA replication/repair protein RecF [Chloroflexota bacterium]
MSFPAGPNLVWGPNAAGKTSLVEAIVLLSRGSSHRTSSDADLVRWSSPLARAEGQLLPDRVVEVILAREGPSAGRKRIRVAGTPRRAAALPAVLRSVVFAPEDMLLVVGSPGLRRSAVDAVAAQRHPAHARDLVTYGRALAQRNALLRAIREEQAGRDDLPPWDEAVLEAGAAVVGTRLELLGEVADPLAAAHAEIAPGEGRLTVTYESNAVPLPGETPRQALARRLAETAQKEIWNGSTLVGPHRDDLAFRLEGRDLAGFASRGQQRTAILAWKLAELDLLTAVDGRPPLLLLDDVFSELDPGRRAHLVRRIAGLPQAFVTTTTLADLDPDLRAHAVAWEVLPDQGDGARLLGPSPAAAAMAGGVEAT